MERRLHVAEQVDQKRKTEQKRLAARQLLTCLGRKAFAKDKKKTDKLNLWRDTLTVCILLGLYEIECDTPQNTSQYQ